MLKVKMVCTFNIQELKLNRNQLETAITKEIIASTRYSNGDKLLFYKANIVENVIDRYISFYLLTHIGYKFEVLRKLYVNISCVGDRAKWRNKGKFIEIL